MKHTHTRTLLIFGILVALVVAALYFYMIKVVDSSFVDIASAKEEIKYEQAKKSDEQNLVNLKQSVGSPYDKLSKYFVTPDHQINFIEAIEAITKDSGSVVSISSIEADDMNATTTGSIRAHVETKGSWSSVMKALELAENLPYALTINNVHIDFSALDQKATKREWKMTFEVSAAMIPSNSNNK